MRHKWFLVVIDAFLVSDILWTSTSFGKIQSSKTHIFVLSTDIHCKNEGKKVSLMGDVEFWYSKETGLWEKKTQVTIFFEALQKSYKCWFNVSRDDWIQFETSHSFQRSIVSRWKQLLTNHCCLKTRYFLVLLVEWVTGWMKLKRPTKFIVGSLYLTGSLGGIWKSRSKMSEKHTMCNKCSSRELIIEGYLLIGTFWCSSISGWQENF